MAEGSAWMPLYIGDYLADTMHLNSAAEHGAYLLLIMHYWRNGPLPDDDKELADVAKMTPKEWCCIAQKLRKFFDCKEAYLFHKRIDAELARASLQIEQKRAAGRASAKARSGWNHGGNGGSGGNGCSTAVQRAPVDNSVDNSTAVPTEQQRPLVDNSTAVPTAVQRLFNPLPSPSSLKEKEEEKEKLGRDDVGVDKAKVRSLVLAATKALKTKPPPFSPSVEYQLSALVDARERFAPQEPERSVDEQLKILEAG